MKLIEKSNSIAKGEKKLLQLLGINALLMIWSLRVDIWTKGVNGTSYRTKEYFLGWLDSQAALATTSKALNIDLCGQKKKFF